MKNGQKYAKEINQMVNKEYFECSLWSIRNGKRALEDCRHIPESYDPVSSRDKFCQKCLCESLEWLNQEYKDQYKDPILDEVEKKYLSSAIKPFRKNIKYIRKNKSAYKDKQFILIVFYDGNYMYFPFFENDAMYKGMELDKKYSLEELGL